MDNNGFYDVSMLMRRLGLLRKDRGIGAQYAARSSQSQRRKWERRTGRRRKP